MASLKEEIARARADHEIVRDVRDELQFDPAVTGSDAVTVVDDRIRVAS